MIIVIRGTNGSGKSYTVRQILAKATETKGTPDGNGMIIRLNDVKRPIVIVGPYIEGRSMGGCDCIRQPSKIYNLVEWADDRAYHVILEGVVLATRPWFKYRKEQNMDVRYAFLDPHTEDCLLNIRNRQAKKGHISTISREAMENKRARAHMMFIEAKNTCMPTKRFTEAKETVKWIREQLRHP